MARWQSGLAIALVLGLAACGPSDPPDGPGPATQLADAPAPDDVGEAAPPSEPALDTAAETPVAPMAAPMPTGPVLKQVGETYTANAVLPAELVEIAPALDARLRADILAAFDEMAVVSVGEAMADPDSVRPWSMIISWTLVARAGDLLSLEGYNYSDTGGAHGNYFVAGLIHDRAAGEDVFVLDLFADRADALERLVPLARAEITAAKMRNFGETGAPSQARRDDTAEVLPMTTSWWRETVLTPSTETDRFGGLKVHFSPYEIGSFAEGAYAASIPQAAFRDLLKPEYAALFGGEPVAYERN